MRDNSAFRTRDPSGCYREGPTVPGAASSKKPFMELQPQKEKKNNGFLRPWLLRLLAGRLTCLPKKNRCVPALSGSRITCGHKPCHADFV